MVPPLPDMPHDDTEFDIDVRLQPVARHGHDLLAASEGEQCPDGPSQYVTNCCSPGCG
jgi:hypothetical protein